MKKLFSSKSEASNGGAPSAAPAPSTLATTASNVVTTKPSTPPYSPTTDMPPSKQPAQEHENSATSPISPTNSIPISPTDTRKQPQLPQPPPQPAKLDTTNLSPPIEADDDDAAADSSSSTHSPGSDTQAAIAPSSPLDSSSSPTQNPALLSPASAEAVSPTLVSPTKKRPSVHFLPSVRTFLEAQAYGHQQRYNLSCGTLQVFDRPPTNHYRFNTLRETGVRGTLAQLVTSASNEGWGRTWDSCTPLPGFAARYQNTYVTRSERTVYWECEILSLGFSKFSSLDSGKPTPGDAVPREEEENGGGGAGVVGGAGLVVPNKDVRPSTSPVVTNGVDSLGVNGDPPQSPDETIASLGLTRAASVSAASASRPTPSRPSGIGLGIGFVVKCVSPETVAYVRRRSSLRPNDEMPSPSSVNGAGVFWWSEDGDVYIDGKRTHKHVPAGVKDVVGIGITYRVPPGVEPTDSPQIVEEKQRRRSSYMAANLPADDLQAVPADVFMVVNGVKTQVCSSDSMNPFEPKMPEYLLGLYDVFPCIVVQGAGVECKIRIGEAVSWTGEGGKEEMARLAMGDRKGSSSTVGRKDSLGLLSPGMRKKKGGWWRAFSWGSNNESKEDIVKEEEPPSSTNGEGEGPKGEESTTADGAKAESTKKDDTTETATSTGASTVTTA